MRKAKVTSREVVPGFAGLVRQAREAAGLSPAKLGELAGVSFGTIYRIEAEERAPSLRVAMLLVRALGLKVWLDSPGEVAGDA